MTRAEALAALVALPLPGRTPQEWRDEVADFCALPEFGQRMVLAGWRTALLEEPGGADVWAEALSVLGVLATVAGEVVGLGAAVTWARSL